MNAANIQLNGSFINDIHHNVGTSLGVFKVLKKPLCEEFCL